MSRPSLKPYAFCKRFLRNESGVASIVAAMLMLLGLGFGALVLDVGHLYLEKRRLQGAVDAAALAAASDPANAAAIARRVLAKNGYAQSATIVTGAYTADPGLPVASRLNADPTAQKNAVRITETVSIPGYLASIFGGSMLSDVVATATATRTPVVSFSAGTALAGISNGQLNAILGGLLGSTLSLSLVNYQALASTNVDALTFLDQLALQAGVAAGTYGDLANTSVTMGQVVAAIRAALNIHPSGNNSAALDALNLFGLQSPVAVATATDNIVNTGIWQKREIGSIVQQTPGQVTFNLLDLITAMTRAYGNGHIVNLNASILPVAGTSITSSLVIGSPMTSIAVARTGTSIATAQTRMTLSVNIASFTLGGLASVQVALPVYLEMASGTATVAAIPCQTGGTMATLSASSQAVRANFGSVSNAELINFSKTPVLTSATAGVKITIVGAPILVGVSGTYSPSAASATTENFTQADIDNATVKSASGNTAIFSGLIAAIHFDLPAGLSFLVSGTVNNVLDLLKPILTTAFSALDNQTDTLLRSLGLRLGVIDTVVHGARCSTPTLVT